MRLSSYHPDMNDPCIASRVELTSAIIPSDATDTRHFPIQTRLVQEGDASGFQRYDDSIPKLVAFQLYRLQLSGSCCCRTILFRSGPFPQVAYYR